MCPYGVRGPYCPRAQCNPPMARLLTPGLIPSLPQYRGRRQRPPAQRMSSNHGSFWKGSQEAAAAVQRLCLRSLGWPSLSPFYSPPPPLQGSTKHPALLPPPWHWRCGGNAYHSLGAAHPPGSTHKVGWGLQKDIPGSGHSWECPGVHTVPRVG